MGDRAFAVGDLAATALFAFEGAAAGALAGLDLLGTLVVGFAVGLAGGMIRDVLLGDLPPAALRSPSLIGVAAGSALGGFVLVGALDVVPELVRVGMDAAGLALFAVLGAQRAFDHGCNVWVISIMGALTATGGGVVRDVLLNRIPSILIDGTVFATAALIGAALCGALLMLGVRAQAALWSGLLVVFSLRMISVILDWRLPSLTAAGYIV